MYTVADSDFQIRGEGTVSKSKFFPPFGRQFGRKIGGRPPGPLPLDRPLRI